MKTDRYTRQPCFPVVKHVWGLLSTTGLIAVLSFSGHADAQSTATGSLPGTPPVVSGTGIAGPSLASPSVLDEPSQPQALSVLNQVIDRLANGAAFDARVRQRVRTDDRTIVGVGTYEQAGQGSGRFQLQMTMLDGQGKHTLQQISDGRLSWTRTQIADQVRLHRVDVGWLEEGARLSRVQRTQNAAKLASGQTPDRVAMLTPRMKVGGWTEMLDQMKDDYVLKLGVAQLQSQSLYVVSGILKASRRAAILKASQREQLPELYPARMNVAIAKEDDPETGFGKGLPVRIEFFGESSDLGKSAENKTEKPSGTMGDDLISLVEIYSVRPISPPPVERFRFENQDATVDIVNETARYEQRFGIRVSAKQRARHRW